MALARQLKRTRTVTRCLVILAATWSGFEACGGDSESPSVPLGDASFDASFDASSESSVAKDGATPDSSPTADASPAVDSGTDSAGFDAAFDSGADAGQDAAQDANADVDAGVITLCGAINTNLGVPVLLQNATATFSQTVSGNFSVAKAIDNVTNDNLGWAIAPNDAGIPTAQTAAFETVANTPNFGASTRLVFVIRQIFNVEHAIGRFRLAATTANRSTFADGNIGTADAGDVGASGIWTVLAPTAQCATTGATMTVQGDQSILVADTNATNVTYVVEAVANLSGITGFRLEALKDPSLPHNGPGTQNLNGNFVISEINVRAGAP